MENLQAIAFSLIPLSGAGEYGAESQTILKMMEPKTENFIQETLDFKQVMEL